MTAQLRKVEILLIIKMPEWEGQSKLVSLDTRS